MTIDIETIKNIKTTEELRAWGLSREHNKDLMEKNQEFFQTFLKDQNSVNAFLNNLFLDEIAIELREEYYYVDFDDEPMLVVKRLAQMIFDAKETRYIHIPNKQPIPSLIFCISDSYSYFGSPWTNEVTNADEYTLSAFAITIETDEKEISYGKDYSESHNEITLKEVSRYIEQLIEIGISKEAISRELEYICCGNEELIDVIKEKFLKQPSQE